MPTITPPFTVPSGQTCLFLTPTNFSGSGESSGGCLGGGWSGVGIGDLSGGTVSLSGTCLTGPGQVVYIQWDGFKVPMWPEGTVIEAVYPVIYVGSYSSSTPADIWLAINGSDYASSPTLDGVGQLSVGSSADSMGNTESTITSATIGVPINDSSVHDGPSDVVVTWAGLAVYVTLPKKYTGTVVNINIGNTKPLGS